MFSSTRTRNFSGISELGRHWFLFQREKPEQMGVRYFCFEPISGVSWSAERIPGRTCERTRTIPAAEAAAAPAITDTPWSLPRHGLDGRILAPRTARRPRRPWPPDYCAVLLLSLSRHCGPVAFLHQRKNAAALSASDVSGPMLS